ncbi:MAG: hypothetical protein CL993_02320 [Euryarchaeota archaeon]|nr:hypothetical protein [Euryarchaeota archaeon]
MPLKFTFHPGNVAHSGAPEVMDTIIPVCRTLGIELFPLEDATSCGAGIIRQANDLLQITLNARTMALAESLGYDILTPCAATLGNLNEDLTKLRNDPLLLAKVNDVLKRTSNLELKGEINIRHILHVMVEDIGLEKIEKMVKNPMQFKIAGYYGPNMQQLGFCGDDDVYDPIYLEELILTLGGTPIEWNSRTVSVGVPGIYSEEETALQQIASTISEAKSQGAQMIVSSCTLSHTMMDIYQGKASRITGIATNLPIIHLSEILSFAFGHHNSRLAQFRTRLAVIGD